MNDSHLGQIDEIDHDLDHLRPNLPLRDFVKDLYIVQIQHRKHEPDHTDHTDQESICPERSRSSSGNKSYRSSVRGVERLVDCDWLLERLIGGLIGWLAID